MQVGWWTAVLLACPAAFGQQPGYCALCDAALHGDVATARQLLDGGADANARDQAGWTPLMLAASMTARRGSGDFLATAKLLLERGADPNLPDGTGRTALLESTLSHASESGIILVPEPLVELLLASGANVNAQAADGATALQQVAGQWASQPGVVRMLLKHGARPNLANQEGRTALMLAAMRGKTETMTLLRSSGADAGLKDSQGKTALDLAVEEGFPEAAALLPAKDPTTAGATFRQARDNALLRHVRAGELKAATDLLAQGADPNAGSDRGAPALVTASGNILGLGLVRLLLEKGAAVNAASSDGTTALMMAAARFNPQVCELLLAHGAVIDARDAQGNTALLRATAFADSFEEDRWHLVRRLLDKGADPKAKNNAGATALMLAAGHACTPAMEALLEHGAEVNARDRAGKTALMIAVRRAHVDAVQLLLDHKAEIDARDNAGRSVLLASIDAPNRFSYQDQEIYSFEIFRLLIESGSNVNVADNEGNTPVLAASRRGYSDAVKLLIEHGAAGHSGNPR